MEEQKKLEELKVRLEELQKALEMYNDLNPKEKLIITPEEQKKDVSNVFVCAYDNISVGLFKRINYSSKKSWSFWGDAWNAGLIYEGLDSDYIGIKETHYKTDSKDNWTFPGTQVIINRKRYVSNCQIQDAMSFDDMRAIMYNEGQIEPYEIGKATSEEMFEVLKYAFNYFKVSKNTQRQKTK